MAGGRLSWDHAADIGPAAEAEVSAHVLSTSDRRTGQTAAYQRAECQRRAGDTPAPVCFSSTRQTPPVIPARSQRHSLALVIHSANTAECCGGSPDALTSRTPHTHTHTHSRNQEQEAVNMQNHITGLIMDTLSLGASDQTLAPEPQ